MKQRSTASTLAGLICLAWAGWAASAQPARFEVLLPSGGSQLVEQRDNHLYFISKAGKQQPAPNGRYIRVGDRAQVVVRDGLVVPGTQASQQQLKPAAAQAARKAAQSSVTAPRVKPSVAIIGEKGTEVIGEKSTGIIGEEGSKASGDNAGIIGEKGRQ